MSRSLWSRGALTPVLVDATPPRHRGEGTPAPSSAACPRISVVQEHAFHCQRCGNCCRHTGEVRVSDAECAAIAGVLGLSLADFTDRFTRLRDDRRGLALTEGAAGACIFLVGSPAACRIQSAKPKQCRDFPFTWGYEDLERVCPASRA